MFTSYHGTLSLLRGLVKSFFNLFKIPIFMSYSFLFVTFLGVFFFFFLYHVVQKMKNKNKNKNWTLRYGAKDAINCIIKSFFIFLWDNCTVSPCGIP
jgi:hypothetical protein